MLKQYISIFYMFKGIYLSKARTCMKLFLCFFIKETDTIDHIVV